MSDDLDANAVAITFAVEAGKQMLESSTSVSEVIDRLRRFLPKIGLRGCSVDATTSFIILSYWHPGQTMPLTTMRDLELGSPRLEVLAGTEALLGRVERGEITSAAALDQLEGLVDAPGPSPWVGRVALSVAVVGWVLFLNGTGWLTVLVALAASTLTFPVSQLVIKLRFPAAGATFLVALIAASIPNLLSAAGLSLLVAPAVVATLFNYLPGRAFVSSVIDGLSGAPVSSLSRGIEALVTAGMLAFGMLLGSQVGAGLGLDYDPSFSAAPVALSVLGGALGVLGLAVAWGMPKRAVGPTVLIGAAGWLIVALAPSHGADPNWVAYGVSSALVGLGGAVAARVQDSSASMYTGVAIMPLVPGFTLYTSMLEFAQGDTSAAANALFAAGIVSLAIAVGVALGLGVARNAFRVERRARRSAA
jgi:uncharacterized membrane protein YjjP (DUF1212 family)